MWWTLSSDRMGRGRMWSTATAWPATPPAWCSPISGELLLGLPTKRCKHSDIGRPWVDPESHDPDADCRILLRHPA